MIAITYTTNPDVWDINSTNQDQPIYIGDFVFYRTKTIVEDLKKEEYYLRYYVEYDEFQAEAINGLLHIHSTIPLSPGVSICYFFVIKQPKPKSKLKAKLYK